LFTRQVDLHMHEGGDQQQGSSFWGRGYYGAGTGSHQAYRFGSNGDIGGGALGLDFATGDFVIGAAGGWSEDQVKYGLGNSKGHSNSWQVGGYAGFTDGQVNADLQVAYADGSFGATKSIIVATVNRATAASFDGNLFKVVGTVGYNASLADFTVRPFIGIDYDSGNTSSFTETGAGAADLTVGKINLDKTNLMLGIDLIPALTGLSPYGRLAYLYDADNKARNISAFFDGNPATAFTVSGVRPDQSEFDIDAGLAYAASDDMSFYVGYQGTYRSDVNRNGVSAGLTIRFGEAAAPPPPPPPAPPPPPPPPPAPPPPVKTFIVFFDFDKSDLTDQAQQVVAQAVTAAKAGGFVKVLVTGHTDTVGSDTYNQALSIRRAQTVKDEMVHEGLDTNGIAIEGKSFHDPLVQTGPGVREPQNRRAVIDLGG
jgi:outer membrane protein OmpA-like peptidoglycan-associated protein